MQTMGTVGVHVPSTHDEERKHWVQVSKTWLLFIVVAFFSLLKVCEDLRSGKRHSRIVSSSCFLFWIYVGKTALCLSDDLCAYLLIFAHCMGSGVFETTLRMILPPSLESRVDETNLSLLEHLYRLITYQPILAHGMVSSVMETILDLLDLIRVTRYQLTPVHGIVSSVMKTISNLLELIRITKYQLILAHGIVSSSMRTIPNLLELIRITKNQLILACGIVINVMKTILHLLVLTSILVYAMILIRDNVSRVMKTIPYLLKPLIRITTYQLILACGIVSSISRTILYPLKHLTGLNTNRTIPAPGHCVVIAIARNCGSTTTSKVFCRNIDNSGSGEGEPFQLRKLENRSFWTNEEVTNNGLTAGCLLEYQDGMCCQSLLGRLHKLAKQDGKQIIFCRNLGGKPLNVDKLLLDFQDDESVYRGLKEAHGYVNLKAHRFQLILEKLFTKLHIARTRINFIGIRAFTIENERITLETMDKERLGMVLNCRENLVSSTAPVHMQLDRLRKVADDDGDDGGDHDVPGVAVVKFEACEFTCEGLISRYKPFIISRDEELVDIQKACGEVIPVPEHWHVLFDTGNEVATSISRKCLLELNLQPDPSKKRKVKLAGGGSGQFETVDIELIIRGYHFKVCALIDAVAEGTDLLVGMDIIKKLFDSGYTIGD